MFLDIITCQNTNAAKKNVFKELNTLFVKKNNISPKNFLTKITAENKEQVEFVEEDAIGRILLKSFEFNMTLLPHQIMIFPFQYSKNITSDLDEYKILDNIQLRCKIYFLSKSQKKNYVFLLRTLMLSKETEYFLTSNNTELVGP